MDMTKAEWTSSESEVLTPFSVNNKVAERWGFGSSHGTPQDASKKVNSFDLSDFLEAPLDDGGDSDFDWGGGKERSPEEGR